VVAGGDGTLHQVVSALEEPATGPCVAPVPVGTGNDFARALGLPRDAEEALEIAVRGQTRRVDLAAVRVGDAGGRAVNFVLGGVGGDVARHVTGERKRRWRRLVYVRALVEELRAVRPREVVVEADGARVSAGRHLAVLVANGSTLGGGIRAAPGASVDDGRLDVVAVRGHSTGQAAATLALLAAGRHLESSRVTRVLAERVAIRGDPDMRFNADGEAFGSGEAELRVLPGALRVPAPPGPAGGG
jgi:diacylglycerol kinase (ATP)